MSMASIGGSMRTVSVVITPPAQHRQAGNPEHQGAHLRAIIPYELSDEVRNACESASKSE